MAMTAPTVVNKAYATWIGGIQADLPYITRVGTINVGPSTDAKGPANILVSGSSATIYYDLVTNTINIDNVT